MAKTFQQQASEMIDRLGIIMRGIDNGAFDPIDYSTHDAEQCMECATDQINKLITEWTCRDFDGRPQRDAHKEHRHLQHERL